jgi:hypothetical protein
MSIWNGGQILLAVLFSVWTLSGIDALAQQSLSCHSASFKTALNTHDDFTLELGGGLLFRVRSQKEPGWFIDIVPAEANTKDYIYPVNLPLRFNANQTLGPGYGETVQSSLAHPHEMRFLLNRSDYDRVFALIGNVLQSYQTSDPDKAVSDFTNAVEDTRKGSLRVTISSYKTDSKTGALTRIKLRVQITTPLDFQFAPGLNPLPWPCHP